MNKLFTAIMSGILILGIILLILLVCIGYNPDINNLGIIDKHSIAYNINSTEKENNFVWNEHYALIRLEDISPNADIVSLQNSVNLLKSKNIPFSIALIPIYKNPAKDITIYLHERPELIELIKNSGATIVLHGCTHQYDGQTGVDFEFWDETTFSPINQNNTEYATQKIEIALNELKKCNITTNIWETPHYTSDNDTKKVVSRYFTILYEGEADKIVINEFGQIIIPTNLYYVKGETPCESTYKILVESLKISHNNDNRTVASFFYHPFLGTKYLEILVNEMLNQGYKIIEPGEYTKIWSI